MMGRQLDHFTISEIVEGYPVPVYRSVYLGQPCVIKVSVAIVKLFSLMEQHVR